VAVPKANGLRSVGYLDCPGGGQVVVEGAAAFVGHMSAPAGTSIIDVSDPSKPRVISRLDVPSGTHSHKVRVGHGLMIVNHEIHAKSGNEPPAGFLGGYSVYDVSDLTSPRCLYRWEEQGRGVHRFDFDGRYAYLSPTLDGYIGNIVMIVDLANPEQPEEVGRWWEPGQWTAGGEQPSWDGTAHRCHHPLRMGDRLYTSYWMGGMNILAIDNMRAPSLVSHVTWMPPFACPVHTALPLPYEIDGRKLLLVAEEDVVRAPDKPVAALRMFDITDEGYPVAIGSFQLDELENAPVPTYSGCHQPSERIAGTEIPVAYFAYGVRIVDVSRPRALREAAYFVPDPASGYDRAQTNDVTIDDRGLIYVIDRHRGMHILERTETG
jgi:hypothetical protein